jgi:hypothetical protein
LLRSRAYVEVTAAMAAVVLVIDAWFDVMSAPDADDFARALVLALCVEIPLAGFLLWVSARVELERRRRSELMHAVVRRLVGRRRAGGGLPDAGRLPEQRKQEKAARQIEPTEQREQREQREHRQRSERGKRG